MTYSEDKMQEFVALLAQHTPDEGLNETSIAELVTYRETEPHQRVAAVYDPAIVILGQGKKRCYLDGQIYDYRAGRYLSLFLPTPIEIEIVEASPDKPLLMAGIKIDLIKIANILLKMDQIEPQPVKSKSASSSVILSEPLNNQLLDPVTRLLRLLPNRLECAVLGEGIINEIYFRMICNDHSGSLRHLLQHRGQVQQIGKVVNHIHRNLEKMISVDELASIINMSPSGFHKIFRQVMHMPPLQYTKSIKLNRAQTLIRAGKNVSEAAHMVGYNSPAQFSREYKRYFGYSPSATSANLR